MEVYGEYFGDTFILRTTSQDSKVDE